MRIRHGGTEHRPAQAQARVLLALLAGAGEQGMSVDRLAETGWGAPVSDSTISVAMHRLRRWLASAVGEAVGVARTASGYRLEPGAVDLFRFRELVAATPELPARERANALAEALALWRGPALADVPPERVDPAVAERIAMEYRAARLSHGRALLASGDAGRAAGELASLAAGHPLDEPVHAAWIEALTAAGRQAEAHIAYEGIRRRLCEEFGIDPGPELRRALARPARDPVRKPAQLPPDVVGFTGRKVESGVLTAILRTHRAAVIVGMGGVGKTSLAVHWAHRAASRFPDGQLYVDLRGYASEPAARPVDVLARFLRALGVPREEIPAGLDASAALYRSTIARRRVLVVLDNAADAAQIRPLLPGAPGCRAVVTGRDALLSADGAAQLSLDVLGELESAELLTAALGRDAEPAAVRTLARACAGLPLALRITVAHLTGRPVAEYAARLQTGDRLAELTVEGDPRSSVRAVFDHSYRLLPERTRWTFRSLSALPATDFTVEAAAGFLGLPACDARRELDRLRAAHLLVARPGGRFGFHDLVREHAMWLAALAEPARHEAAAGLPGLLGKPVTREPVLR
ncbi:BTAD domain-containing putative transcriptional regulator [Amycolatopsis sp.]|uniref:BTAD domain-containing putative transcriptional regulator n=1 Tax=Amycolatopsis sp. TaxID=37632 RepID=UPI002C7B46B2|nr:BTAD domain-containing putative transcriptional regulator [Amycolatopsis sp.]HVV14711.1 BTAD domain-containing putative transcriptional regulator [Amycolatopsis sp.]